LGQFTHGGDRLITVFTDGRGIPVNKSKAAKRFIREIDSKGKTLWQMEELM
jgi:DNA gyrase/topoisomerase IV subunit B